VATTFVPGLTRSRRFADGFEQVLDDGIGLNAFTQRIVIGNDAVAQNGDRQATQITGFRGWATIQQGASLGGGDEMLRRARAGAPGHVNGAHIHPHPHLSDGWQS